MINTLLVEDHELYRMGLSMLLDKAEGITLVAESADGLDGIKKARELSPDVILMDIGLPNIDGIEATQRIKDFNPDVKILIFTSRDSENDVFEAFKAGADGYIMKGANLQKPSANVVTEPEPKKTNNSYGLTERELDVLELMVEGLSNPQIADKLVITKATAKAHVHSILQKLCVSSRTQATVTAMKEGLV